MNPEVIFVFVILIVINSIFNKNKVQKKQQQRQNQQMQNQQSQTQQNQKQQRSTKTDSRDSGDYGLSERRKPTSSGNREKTQPQRQKSRSLLEEVLEQYNIREDNAPSIENGEIAKEAPVKAKKSSTEGHYTDYSKRDQPKKSRKKKEMEAYTKPRKKGVEAGELGGDFFEKTSVEKSEIGAEGFNELLKFDQQSLVRGIVMSEILEKPKSLRNKKVS